MRIYGEIPAKMNFPILFQGSFQVQVVLRSIDVPVIVVFARVHKANLISMADEEIPGPLIPCEPVKGRKKASADDDRMGSLSSHLQRPQGTPGLQISGEKMIDDS